MTGVNAAGATIPDPALPTFRIQILHVAGCPLLAGVHKNLEGCLDQHGMDALIEQVEGPFLSPTVLVGGRDITGQGSGGGPACRVDLPTRDQICRAIDHVAGRRAP